MNKAHPVDLFVIPAEQRIDRGIGSIDRKTNEQVMKDMYLPTTLVMTFPPGELEAFRRLLNGEFDQ
jgi:hypothetical protein